MTDNKIMSEQIKDNDYFWLNYNFGFSVNREIDVDTSRTFETFTFSSSVIGRK